MPPHPSPSYPAETGDPNAPLAAPLAANQAPPRPPPAPPPAPARAGEPTAPRAAPLAANEAPVSAPPESLAPPRWRTNLILFIATVFSVFLAGAGYAGKLPPDGAAPAHTR